MVVVTVRCAQFFVLVATCALICQAKPHESSLTDTSLNSNENSFKIHRQHFRQPLLTLHYRKPTSFQQNTTQPVIPEIYFPCWNHSVKLWGYCASQEKCDETQPQNPGTKFLLAENVFSRIARSTIGCSYRDVQSNLSKQGVCCPIFTQPFASEVAIENVKPSVKPYRSRGQPPLIDRGHLFPREEPAALPWWAGHNQWLSSGMLPTVPPPITHHPSITDKPWWSGGTPTSTTTSTTVSAWKPWAASTTAKPAASTTTKPAASKGSLTSCSPTLYSGSNFIQNNNDRRITGGGPLTPHSFPWLAVIYMNGKHVCGGSLIDSIHILTAAHCVAGLSSTRLNQMRILLGMHNLRSRESSSQEFGVKRAVRHSGYDSSLLYNDVAVITLDRPVKFTETIKPLCLHDGKGSFAETSATVAGWGSLFEGGRQLDTPRQVSLKVWSNSECQATYGHAAPGGIVESHLCAGKLGRDACSGDSGGPLIVQSGGYWKQIAIVSWGIGCGKAHYPGVYSRISHFLPWIESVVNKY